MNFRLAAHLLHRIILLFALIFAIVACSVFEVEVEGTAKIQHGATLDMTASLTEATPTATKRASATPSPTQAPSPTATEPPAVYPEALYAPLVGQGLWFEDYLWAVCEGLQMNVGAKHSLIWLDFIGNSEK